MDGPAVDNGGWLILLWMRGCWLALCVGGGAVGGLALGKEGRVEGPVADPALDAGGEGLGGVAGPAAGVREVRGEMILSVVGKGIWWKIAGPAEGVREESVPAVEGTGVWSDWGGWFCCGEGD